MFTMRIPIYFFHSKRNRVRSPEARHELHSAKQVNPKVLDGRISSRHY